MSSLLCITKEIKKSSSNIINVTYGITLMLLELLLYFQVTFHIKYELLVYFIVK